MARKRRTLLGKKPCLKGKIERTELPITLREQNELPKKQKCNLKSDLKEKIAMKKQVNKLLCGIKLLCESNFYSLSDKSQINEVLLESAFRRLLIPLLYRLLILLLYILFLLPFVSDISSACQIWQLLQQLLQFLFGSGPG
jgi:hypothetical protein